MVIDEIRPDAAQSELDMRFFALLESLEKLPKPISLKLPLAMAAGLIEFAAFESAQTKTPGEVSRLIKLAVELQTLAEQIETTGKRMN